MQYPGATLGKPKPKRRRNHPTMGYSHDTPFDQDEER